MLKTRFAIVPYDLQCNVIDVVDVFHGWDNEPLGSVDDFVCDEVWDEELHGVEHWCGHAGVLGQFLDDGLAFFDGVAADDGGRDVCAVV